MTRNTNRYTLPAVALALCLGSATAFAGQITATAAAGWPNGRTVSGETPAAVIDGSVNTYTFTTDPNNIATPSYLAIAFDASDLTRIRLWKYAYGGGGNNAKNLTIQYTTDTTSDLTARNYTTVSSLVSGFAGTEFWDGTVNPNGTVTNDVHDSTTDGWGSLTFTPVIATGVRIAFSNPNPIVAYCDGTFQNQACNHYQVAEFQAYDVGAVPEPASLLMLVGGLAFLATVRRQSGNPARRP